MDTRFSISAGPSPLDSFTIYMEKAKEILPASADDITTTRVAFALALKDNEKALTQKDVEKQLALMDKENDKALALKDSEKALALKDSEAALALKVSEAALALKDAAFALEKQRMETISTQKEACRMMEISALSQR